MKQYLIVFAVLVVTMLSITACSEDAHGPEIENPELFTLNIRYDGKEFTVPCTYDAEKNEIVFLDEEFDEFFDAEIAVHENLAVITVHDENDVEWVEYYATEQELLDAHKLTFSELKAEELTSQDEAGVTRATGLAGRAYLWDDTRYRDSWIYVPAPYDSFYSIPNLKNFAGFNDKCSSLKVYNDMPASFRNFENGRWYSASEYCLILMSYEDSKYKGGVLYCIANLGEVHEDSSLHQIPFSSKKSWNDRISSLVFRIAIKGDFKGH